MANNDKKVTDKLDSMKTSDEENKDQDIDGDDKHKQKKDKKWYKKITGLSNLFKQKSPKRDSQQKRLSGDTDNHLENRIFDEDLRTAHNMNDRFHDLPKDNNKDINDKKFIEFINELNTNFCKYNSDDED